MTNLSYTYIKRNEKIFNLLGVCVRDTGCWYKEVIYLCYEIDVDVSKKLRENIECRKFIG